VSIRGPVPILSASLVAAVVSAATALSAFLGELPSRFGWPYLILGGAFVYLGRQAYDELRTQSEVAAQRQSQVTLLHVELEQHRSSVDDLADGLDTAVFICDSGDKIEFANRRARELFGFDEPIGRSIVTVTLSYELGQLVSRLRESKQPQSAEILFTYPSERVGQAKSWTADGERIFLSVYEITDLRRLERIRQDFVANVSHELRTPMTIIRAMAETLLDDPDDERREKYLTKIVAEVDRLSTISQDLLVLSTAESNPVRKQACDVAEVFRSVLGQLDGKASDKGLETAYEGPEHLTIEANSAQMTQVALNLVDNAINYTIDGSVIVQIEPRDEKVLIKVRDTGMGIAGEHLPRIFERFYRVDKARSRSTGGTGLGLSIVRHIVEAHGGTVVVESALNQGSTFTVTLPVS